MKIDSNFQPTSPPTTGRAQTRLAADKAPASAAAEPVQFSVVATQLQSETQPPVDRARVQEIKQAIAEGRFKINTGAIADRVLASARELVDSQRRA